MKTTAGTTQYNTARTASKRPVKIQGTRRSQMCEVLSTKREREREENIPNPWFKDNTHLLLK